jgi:hypothetical protein
MFQARLEWTLTLGAGVFGTGNFDGRKAPLPDGLGQGTRQGRAAMNRRCGIGGTPNGFKPAPISGGWKWPRTETDVAHAKTSVYRFQSQPRICGACLCRNGSRWVIGPKRNDPKVERVSNPKVKSLRKR